MIQNFFFLIFSLFLLVKSADAQNKILFSAKIVDAEKNALIGAILRWQNTEIATTTDENGWFAIERVDTINGYNLQISYEERTESEQALGEAEAALTAWMTNSEVELYAYRKAKPEAVAEAEKEVARQAREERAARVLKLLG